MKRIGIDARLYSQTGVGVYLKNLLYWLQKKAPSQLQFYVYLMKQDFDKVTCTNKNFIKKESDYNWHSFQEQIFFGKQLADDKLDLMHFTYFSYPIVYKKKFIATIHDLTPLLFKTGRASSKSNLIYNLKHFFFKFILSTQINNSSAIITPTSTVKQQIIKAYGEKYASKIFPVYEGINLNLLKIGENASLKKKYKNFFIYVGNFYPHKNVEKLIEAFSQVDPSYQLILLGPSDFFAERVLQSINRLKQNNRIVLFADPDLSDLVFFYRNAKALIHPSLSEGFGLPLVEAMYFNLPIIASDIPVFKEILDNRYLAFNPDRIPEMRRKIEFFINNQQAPDYSRLLKKYSFENMAEKTLKIYLKDL